jgi:diadenosine tetraphosphate (Ap4A) HIT family hydrolase
MAQIHPQLEKDCLLLGNFPLSYLLLNRDANYPWFILVPDREDISEIYQLTANDQQQLMVESCHLAESLALHFNADKMNIAALGNIVPQLHLHHIVRYKQDKAWPAPVWGKLEAQAYTNKQLAQLIEKTRALKLSDFTFTI